MKYATLLSVFVVASATACGAAAPRDALTQAEASVRAAEVGGAEESPQAKLHLKHARDQVTQAKQLMEDGDNEKAAALLDRALVDAEVALATARRVKARAEADELLQEAEDLRQRMKGN